MKSNNFDNVLIQGLYEFKELEFSKVPPENEIDHTFSEKYIKERNRIIKQLGHPYNKFINTTIKKVAIIILTLIIAFSSLMTVDAIREKVLNLVYRVFPSFTVIDSKSEHEDYIQTYYAIPYIPTDFAETISKKSTIVFSKSYENINHQDIVFIQALTSNPFLFDSEKGELKEEIINDTPCLTCENKSKYYCYWEFDGYRFELVYPAELGKQFMSDVVGKLIEIEPENNSN